MFDIYENRRKNLNSILKQFPSKAALAERLSRSSQQVGAMLLGRRTFGTKTARDFEQSLGLPSGWLDMEYPPEALIQSNVDVVDVTPVLEHQPSTQIQSIPGKAIAEQPLEIRKLRLSKEELVRQNEFIDLLKVRNSWLFSQPISTNDPNALRIVTVEGDEMAPTIKRGDIALLDISQTKVTANGVYAINNAKTLSFNRIQVLPSGQFSLIFDNEKYKSLTIDSEELVVIGRCLLTFSMNPV